MCACVTALTIMTTPTTIQLVKFRVVGVVFVMYLLRFLFYEFSLEAFNGEQRAGESNLLHSLKFTLIYFL